MEETWKDIPGYENHYVASNTGYIKSIKFNKEILMKPFMNKKGYLVCELSKKNKRKKFKVHQLIAMSFLNHTPCGMKLIIDHINDIKTDNQVDNLRIVTNRENSHRVKNKINTSKYKGVYKQGNKWRAQAVINKTKIHVGMHTSEDEAAKALEDFYITHNIIAKYG